MKICVRFGFLFCNDFDSIFDVLCIQIVSLFIHDINTNDRAFSGKRDMCFSEEKKEKYFLQIKKNVCSPICSIEIH